MKQKIGMILTLILYFLLCFVIGIWGGLKIAQLSDTVALNTATELLLLVGLLLAFYFLIFLQLILHETGHLLFGLLTGYRFLSFRIGNLMWMTVDGKIRLKRFSLKGTGGQCLMAVPACDPDDLPVFLYNLGGVIVNLITAIFAFAISLIPGIGLIPQFLLQLFAVFGIVFAAINGLPVPVGAIENDGKNAWNLHRNKQTRLAFWQQLKINEAIQNGIPLRDQPEAWFQPSDANNGLSNTIRLFRFNRLIDQSRFEEAATYGQTIIDEKQKLIAIHRNGLECELLFLELIGKNRAEEIEKRYTKQLKQILKVSKTQPSILRIQYAIDLLSDKNIENAKRTLQAFHKVAKHYPHQADLKSEQKLIRIVQELAKERGIIL